MKRTMIGCIMGWSSGGEIFNVVARGMQDAFEQDEIGKQIVILTYLIRVLEEGDCDVLDESFGISTAGDLALKQEGYHNWQQDCKVDYSPSGREYPEKCSCGWEEKW